MINQLSDELCSLVQEWRAYVNKFMIKIGVKKGQYNSDLIPVNDNNVFDN